VADPLSLAASDVGDDVAPSGRSGRILIGVSFSEDALLTGIRQLPGCDVLHRIRGLGGGKCQRGAIRLAVLAVPSTCLSSSLVANEPTVVEYPQRVD